jgi:ankyrin repeat protein
VLRTAFRNRRHWRAVVPLLVEAGADVKAKNEWGFTPLWYAVNLITANNGGLEVAILLLDKGAEVDPPLRAGDTPLLAAATAGHLELVKVLLEHGADPTKAGRKGRTPLSAARECGHTEIAKLLESRKPAR